MSNEEVVAFTGRVQGRVQGVSYRYSMQRAAIKYCVVGWVMNLADGSVGFHAEGSSRAVERLVGWSRQGPSYARVDAVDIEPATPQDLLSFEIRV